MKSRLALLAALLGVIPFVGAGPWCRRTAADAVRTCCGDARRDDTGRLLEHRGPVRDRPSRPRRSLRARELRQQVPGRGGRVHGHRPRRHLRRRGGDRGWLQSPMRPTPTRAGEHLACGRDRDRRVRHARRPAADARAWMRAVRRSSTPTTRHTWPPSPAAHAKNAGVAVGERVAQAVLAKRVSDGLERNPTVADLEPAARGTWRLATESLGARARPAPARRQAARARERFAVPPRRPQCAHQQGVRRRRERGRAPGARRQRLQDARADDPGALLDRSRPQAVERRHAPSRRRSGAGPRADGADAGHGARGGRRRDDRLLRRQVPLLVLAALPGDPAGSQRRQPGDRGRSELAAARAPRRTSPSTPRPTPVTAVRSSRPWMRSSVPTTSPSPSTAASPTRPRRYARLQDVVDDVDLASILVGFHFRNSDLEGSSLGRNVGRFVASHLFQPLG